jgi:alcohol dehydrogenase class IV
MLNTIYCRVFQWFFNIGAMFLTWRKAVLVEGAGSIASIPELLRKSGVTKPLLVIRPGEVKGGAKPKIAGILEEAGFTYSVFSQVEPNPSVKTVDAVQLQYLDETCDGFIAFGGGSPLDAAKAAAARVVRPKRTVNQLGGLLTVRKRVPPFIAVPTTAGTGSETTIAAVITDTETHHKYAIMDTCLVPTSAVLDPELTLGLPPSLTAATGMDALTHAIEAFLCWTYNTAESIRFALDAVKLVFASLETAYTDGANMNAREAMLRASYKAGWAFTRAGVGNVHAIAHTLGGLYNTPHGLANAVILPEVLEDYGAAVHDKLAALADAAGIAAGGSSADKAGAFIQAIYAMNARMGIPRTFDFINDADIDRMVAWALKEANPLYPVPVVYDAARFRKVIKSLSDPKLQAFRR